MAKMKLTARAVAAYTTDRTQEDVWDELVPGLALRVGRTGSKTWMVRYRANGRHRRMKLGTYPHLSLADARERARRALADAQAGEDPAADRQLRRSVDATFGALVEEVLEVKARETREKTQRERRRIANKDLLPAWKDRPAGSIRSEEHTSELQSRG